MVELLLVARVRDHGWRVEDAALAAGVSVRTAYKWLARWRAGGERALHDRSSAPARSPRRLPLEITAEIERLRRQRLSGPQIARRLGRPVATVGLVLRRLGLGRRAALEPRPAVIRYQRAGPGELLHIDTRSSAASTASATASPAIAAGPAATAAGRSCTSPSTMPPGSPTARSCPTSARPARSPSSTARSPGSLATASPSSAS